MALIDELKRRNVIRVGIAYLAIAWLLLQVLDVVGPILQLPATLPRYLLFLLVVGFIPALALAWVFEWTPQGVRRERDPQETSAAASAAGRRLDRAIIATLALAVGMLLFDRLLLNRTTEQPEVRPAAAMETVRQGKAGAVKPAGAPPRKSLAVLPFTVMSTGPDDDYFADGLTEEIINALAQVPDLLVTARTSAFYFKDRNLPVEEIAGQLGVAHVLEGSVRRAGEQLRVSAQLIRAEDGFNLWSQSYDQRAGDLFAVQTDIAEQVAQALDVLLDDSLRERMQRMGTRNVDAFIELQKGMEFYERGHSEAGMISLLRQANRNFEQAIELEPGLYAAHAYHSDLYTHILIDNANGQPEGEITAADVAAAPAALGSDFENAVRYARSGSERDHARFAQVFVLGPWRGLALWAGQAAASPNCDVALWLHLVTAPFGQAALARRVYDRIAACDPLRTLPQVYRVGSTLWQGDAAEAELLAREGLRRLEHSLLAQHLALAQAFSGRFEEALQSAADRIRAEDVLLLTRAQVAAIRGNAGGAETYLEDYLGKYGANDRTSLVLQASLGLRNEANRLAADIDRRPYGHLVLMQAVYFCYCGAPFDPEATPVFATMLAESGLDWPPPAPYDLPLKDW